MTTEEAVLLALPILPYHRQCRIEMKKLEAQRKALHDFIELRKSNAAAMPSPLILKVDMKVVEQMINN